ncbi:hypothetical protein PIB30_025405 [Stylosanthes scabra]|uniref:Uncharacterized protein n=1 Tax=Stylosanthes scabra TaxID=79078 RepID=A0ABU6RAB7_9FABA|nr:hypothetical protein [Stylosanthes scabra]
MDGCHVTREATLYQTVEWKPRTKKPSPREPLTVATKLTSASSSPFSFPHHTTQLPSRLTSPRRSPTLTTTHRHDLSQTLTVIVNLAANQSKVRLYSVEYSVTTSLDETQNKLDYVLALTGKLPRAPPPDSCLQVLKICGKLIEAINQYLGVLIISG